MMDEKEFEDDSPREEQREPGQVIEDADDVADEEGEEPSDEAVVEAPGRGGSSSDRCVALMRVDCRSRASRSASH